MNRSSLLFPYYVHEIASRLVIGVVGSKLLFNSDNDIYSFEVVIDDLVVMRLDREGYELLKSNDSRLRGTWSEFLEGGSREVSIHFLRKLSDAGIKCVDPDVPTRRIKKRIEMP